MFELPDAKRVRREDLASSSEDEAPSRDDQQDAELRAKLHARMAGMLDLSHLKQAPAAAETKTKKKKAGGAADESPSEGSKDEDEEMGDDGGNDDNGPEEFEFRLFSTTDPATKIALVDEDELALQKEGAMARTRPLSYYIAEGLTPEARAEMEAMAMSGEEVLERAGQRWWGMEMPWRVTRIEAAAAGKKKDGETGAADEAARRRRPGKKKRIALRMKERERKKKAEEEEKAKTNKEEHLKDKKKRLNRLKKLRRRAKDKEAKQGGPGAEGEDSGSGSEGAD